MKVWAFACLVLGTTHVASNLILNETRADGMLRDASAISASEVTSDNPLGKSIIGGIIDLFTPTIIQDLYKLLIKKPPLKLAQPRNVPHGSLLDVKNNLVRSLVSICPAEKILSFKCLCSSIISNVSVLENKDFDSLVTVGTDVKDKTIIVSYRASLTAQNWVTNFEYPMVDLITANKGVKVHHGFLSNYYSNYFSVREAVTKLLDNPEFKDYKLHVTGYSLGAGVATISLPDWVSLLKSRSDPRKIEAYAYASPRPGNEAFAQFIASLNVPITRYSNKNDIVPHLPPRSGGFVHAAPEVHERTLSFGRSELVECSQEYDEDPQCGWKENSPVSIAQHLLPMNGLIPLPPYC